MIVDTSAIVAILQGEPGHQSLMRAILRDPDPLMSAATALELYAVADGRGELAQRRRVDSLLKVLRVRPVPFDTDQAQIARDAYRDFGRGSGGAAKLNLGDCFSYALAAHTSQSLLFVGQDFARTDIRAVQIAADADEPSERPAPERIGLP